MEKEANAIKRDSLKMAWSMRGGVTYDQILMLSLSEREMIAEICKENLEVTKKTNLPFF